MGREGRDRGSPAPWMDTPLGIGSPRERRSLPEKQWRDPKGAAPEWNSIPAPAPPRPHSSVPSPQPQGPPIQSLLIGCGGPPPPPGTD